MDVPKWRQACYSEELLKMRKIIQQWLFGLVLVLISIISIVYFLFTWCKALSEICS